MASERPPIIVVTDVHLDPIAANGFSPRYYALLKALSADFEVYVALLEATYRPVDESRPTIAEDLTDPHFFRFSGRVKGDSMVPTRLGRIKSLCLSTLPSFSHNNCDLKELQKLIDASMPTLAIICGRNLAHLVYRVEWHGAVILAFMEEDFDRGILPRFTRRARIGSVLERQERRHRVRHYRMIRDQAWAVVAISKPEEERLRILVEHGRTLTIPLAMPEHIPRPCKDETEWDVIVSGDMRATRNSDPMLAILRAPAARSLKWVICGPHEEDFVSKVKSLHPQVQVTGYVAELSSYYWRSRIAVVPSTEITGVKTAVLKAWAYGVPVVATPEVSRGLPLRHEVNALIASSPEGLLECVLRLLQDGQLASNLTEGGLSTLARLPTNESIDKAVRKLCLEACRFGPIP